MKKKQLKESFICLKRSKDHDQEYANKILSDMIDEIKQKGLEAMQHKFAQEDGSYGRKCICTGSTKSKSGRYEERR